MEYCNIHSELCFVFAAAAGFVIVVLLVLLLGMCCHWRRLRQQQQQQQQRTWKPPSSLHHDRHPFAPLGAVATLEFVSPQEQTDALREQAIRATHQESAKHVDDNLASCSECIIAQSKGGAVVSVCGCCGGYRQRAQRVAREKLALKQWRSTRYTQPPPSPPRRPPRAPRRDPDDIDSDDLDDTQYLDRSEDRPLVRTCGTWGVGEN